MLYPSIITRSYATQLLVMLIFSACGGASSIKITSHQDTSLKVIKSPNLSGEDISKIARNKLRDCLESLQAYSKKSKSHYL